MTCSTIIRLNYSRTFTAVMSAFEYSGTELKLFSTAQNWKSYICDLIKEYIKNDVLEVGAGIGQNTRLLYHPEYHKWICLEPDIKLYRELESLFSSYEANEPHLQNGTITGLAKEQLFDSILYLDVLEHILEDSEEVLQAYQHLKPEGYLIVLAPAHQCLFTQFDAAIGHYRRYSKLGLKVLLPRDMKVVRLLYVDCAGLLASLANKLILQQKQPTYWQIKTWDKLMIPVSKKLDRLLQYRLGKSVLLIGRKQC
ncbi:class I SAM-dependent methyltransferase [Leptolyngbya sp. AN02str]|uniref:class I SAM-dependent methyltransferase n=1 Tax=Leptolyngbya sp. AN02str TaxID=3423363 RepID=UPI003D313CD5